MATTRLLSVCTFTRYGQRHPYTMPVTHWNVTGNGSLTESGRQQMTRLGQKARERYQEQLFSKSEPDIIAKSSVIPRCAESAALTLQGLSPGSQVEVEKDPVFRFNYVDPPEDFLSTYKAKYANLISMVGEEVLDRRFQQDNVARDTSIDDFVLQLMIHCDNVRHSMAIGLPVPNFVKGELLEQIHDYLHCNLKALTRNPGLLKSEVSRVVTAILTILTTAADRERPTILVINSHDLLVDWILMALYVEPERHSHQPPAATITFELHEDIRTKERVIKMWHMKDVESFPGELIRTVTPTDLIAELENIPEQFN